MISFTCLHIDKFLNLDGFTNIDTIEKAKNYKDIVVRRNGKTFMRRQLIGSDKEELTIFNDKNLDNSNNSRTFAENNNKKEDDTKRKYDSLRGERINKEHGRGDKQGKKDGGQKTVVVGGGGRNEHARRQLQLYAPEKTNDGKNFHAGLTKYGVDMQSLPDSLSSVVVVTNTATLKKDRTIYNAAKYGSVEGKDEDGKLLGILLSPKERQENAKKLIDNLNQEKIKDIANQMKQLGVDVIVSSEVFEGKSINEIPNAYSAKLKKYSEISISYLTIESKQVGSTGLNKEQRAKNKVVFSADKELKGKKIAIVDDVYTSGSTILSAMKAIIDAGGIPTFVTSISSSRTGKQLKPSNEKIKEMLNKLNMLESQFKDEFKYNPNQLTGKMIQDIINR
jgi:orotate phosphoribosyltransferase